MVLVPNSWFPFFLEVCVRQRERRGRVGSVVGVTEARFAISQFIGNHAFHFSAYSVNAVCCMLDKAIERKATDRTSKNHFQQTDKVPPTCLLAFNVLSN